jgi:hypothetical protein
MDETQGPGHLLAPGLLKDYCQIFHWQLISASIEAVSQVKVEGGPLGRVVTDSSRNG